MKETTYRKAISERMGYIVGLTDAEVRFHTYHLNGWSYFDYNQNWRKEDITNQWKALIKDMPEQYIISEPLPSFGYEIDGKLVNMETVIYQTVIKELWLSGLLETHGRSMKILEIGGGHGQLAYHLKQITGAEITLLDLPTTLILAKKYLAFHKTEAKFYSDYKDIKGNFDLVIACRAFNEMNDGQIRIYSDFVYEHMDYWGKMYVWAGDSSSLVADNGNVSEIFSERFEYKQFSTKGNRKSFASRLLDISPRKIFKYANKTNGDSPFHRIYFKKRM